MTAESLDCGSGATAFPSNSESNSADNSPSNRESNEDSDSDRNALSDR